jgi:hypothetical protein
MEKIKAVRKGNKITFTIPKELEKYGDGIEFELIAKAKAYRVQWKAKP